MSDSIEFMLRKGFMSLAGRTLELLESSMPSLREYVSPRDMASFAAFSDGLKSIAGSGEVYSIGEVGKANLAAVIGLLDSAIPEQFKPQSHEECYKLAVSAISSYHGIPTEEEIARRAGLKSIQHAPATGFCFDETWDKQGVHRSLYYAFEPQGRALSVLTNVYNLHLALQPEDRKLVETFEELMMIPGIAGLMSAIETDEALSQIRTTVASSSQVLNLFLVHGMLGRVHKAGTDVEQLKAFLSKKIPLANFLTCYSLGDAYVRQADIIGSAHDLQDTVPSQMYRLLALAEALHAPFREPRKTVHWLGIGMYEHFANNPEMRRILIESSLFHRNLTEDYFILPHYS